MTRLLITSVFILVTLAGAVNGACYISPILTATGALGTVRNYCYIRELNLNITVGDYVKSMDTCYEYNCFSQGLDACGFGFRAGIMFSPGCKTINVACQPVFIQDPRSPMKCIMVKDPVTMPTPTGPPTVTPPTLPSHVEDCQGPLGSLMCAGNRQTLRVDIIIALAIIACLNHRFIY